MLEVSSKSGRKPQPAASAESIGGVSAQAKAEAQKKQQDEVKQARLRALQSQPC